MATLRNRKYNYLIKQGLTHLEATKFSSVYTLTQMRELPYIQRLIRSRRLLRANLKKKGYTPRNIQGVIANLYLRNEWVTPDGKTDVWEMLRSFRKKSIDAGDYKPPERKGSHHGKGVTREEVEGQAKDQKTIYLRQLKDTNFKLTFPMPASDRARLIDLKERLERKLK